MVPWFVSVAQAGIPVVFDGIDGSAEVARVAERTGLPESQLEAWPLSRLRAVAPNTRGEAVLRRCPTEAVDADPVRADYARAKSAFVREDRFEAMDHLDLAVAKIGCLSEVVDRKVASLVFVFRGALTATSGAAETDAETARGEFRTAIELTRDLAYPDWLPDAARPVFEAAMAEVDAADDAPLATLDVVPASTVSGPWVDGVEVDGRAELRPGLHLLQYSTPQGIRSGWLSIGGPGQIALPGQMRGPVLEGMRAAPGQAIIAALVDVAVDDLTAAYVSYEGGLWLVSKQGDELGTQVIEAPDGELSEPPESTDDDDDKKRRRRRKRRKKDR